METKVEAETAEADRDYIARLVAHRCPELAGAGSEVFIFENNLRPRDPDPATVPLEVFEHVLEVIEAMQERIDELGAALERRAAE
jgi:hypothetical protein